MFSVISSDFPSVVGFFRYFFLCSQLCCGGGLMVIMVRVVTCSSLGLVFRCALCFLAGVVYGFYMVGPGFFYAWALFTGKFYACVLLLFALIWVFCWLGILYALYIVVVCSGVFYALVIILSTCCCLFVPWVVVLFVLGVVVFRFHYLWFCSLISLVGLSPWVSGLFLVPVIWSGLGVG